MTQLLEKALTELAKLSAEEQARKRYLLWKSDSHI